MPLAPGLKDTPELRENLYNNIMNNLEAKIDDKIRDDVVVKRIFALTDFKDRYNAYKGTALGLSHTLMTECNGCFGSLFESNHLLKEDEEFKGKINGILSEVDREFKGDINVRHFAEILYNDVGVEKLTETFTKPLNLNVAVHYGCHFLKPSAEIGVDDPMKPTILDELVEATGAKSVPYKDKMMCCGAGGGLRSRDLDVTLDYTKEKLDNMKHKVSSLPVVDDDKLVGIVTATDLGHNLILDKYELGTTVETVMVKDVICVDPENSLLDTVKAM